jgi:dihydroorotate dehydrogenase (NAD+) catalytic subunit
MAKVVADSGADAVSLTNTFLAMSIDVETRRPRLSNITGGLSGPAIKPIAAAHGLRGRARRQHSHPRPGRNRHPRRRRGVSHRRRHRNVQVGTASYADPRATERLARGLESWCRSHSVEKVSSLTSLSFSTLPACSHKGASK